MTGKINSSLKAAISAGYELRDECELIKLSARNYGDTVLMDRLTEASENLDGFSETLGDLVTPYKRAESLLGKARRLRDEMNAAALEAADWKPGEQMVIREALLTLEDAICSLEEAAGR